MVEERDLRIYARALAAPASPHLNDADWERFACGEMSRGERQVALGHVVRCAACAAICRGVLVLAEAAPGFDRGAPRAFETSRQTATLGWLRGGLAALAAGLALFALSVGPLERRPAPPGSDVLRSLQSPRPVPLAPLGAQASAPPRFRWRAFPAATAYRVELFDGSGRLVWASARLSATQVEWPEGIATDAGLYYWHVLALRGRSEAAAVTSPLVDFSIARARP